MPSPMPNGKWRARRMIQGQRKTKVFPTKQEAKKWEAAQEAAAWAEENSMTHMASLLEFANAYLDIAAERFVKKTLSEKKLAFKYLFRVVPPTTRPEHFTSAMALDALRQVYKDASGNAANVARKNLLTAWNWGKKYYGLPKVNPFAEVEKFPADARPRYVPPEEDFWKAYEKASQADKVMLLLMLHTGARRMEVFRLQWSDVDMSSRKIRFGTRKSGHGGMEYAWVPMTTELYNALAGHRLASRSAVVFTDPETGEAFRSRAHFMKTICARAGVSPFGFHAIRHLSATILAHDPEMDIPSVQAVLRHKNPNTTARYIKSLGLQPDKLDRVFAKRKGPKVLPFEPLQKAIGT